MSRFRIGDHAAENTVTGVISSGASWYETFQIKDQNGDDVTGLTGDTFQFQFRDCADERSTDLTLSTADGYLSVTEEDGVTTVTVNVPQSTISHMDGDFIADLVSKNALTGRLTHRAHGVVTFRNDPVAF